MAVVTCLEFGCFSFKSFKRFNSIKYVLNVWNAWNYLNGVILFIQPIDVTAGFQLFEKTDVGEVRGFCLCRFWILCL